MKTILAKHIIILVLIICSGWSQQLNGQELYPGDVNDNGIANSVDLLYLGIAYGATGPERTDGDSDWSAQIITSLWGQSFPSGLNYAYADCDGDGVIDDEDIEDAILENFGETHGTIMPDGFDNGVQGNAPVLKLIPNTNLANAGSTLSFDIILGSVDMPIQDFYGLAFTMTYDVEFIEEDDDEAELDLVDNSWIDPTNGSLSRNLIVFDDSGHAEIGITRINQQAIAEGFGAIATFSIVIEDDIASNVIDTFNIEIDSVKLIGVNQATFSIAPRDTFVLVGNDTTLSNIQNLIPEKIKIFPNPANHSISIESPLPFDELSIYNLLGQKIHTHTFSNYRPSQKLIFNQHIPSIPDGIYFIHLKTNKSIITKQFIIHQ